MSKSFTPGPWQIKSGWSKEDCCTIIANLDGEFIDGVNHNTYDTIARCCDEFEEYNNESDANARLIAAAPDLFAAMERMIKAELSGSGAEMARARHQATAALAKARGDA